MTGRTFAEIAECYRRALLGAALFTSPTYQYRGVQVVGEAVQHRACHRPYGALRLRRRSNVCAIRRCAVIFQHRCEHRAPARVCSSSTHLPYRLDIYETVTVIVQGFVVVFGGQHPSHDQIRKPAQLFAALMSCLLPSWFTPALLRLPIQCAESHARGADG